jgi:hypothetical protein
MVSLSPEAIYCYSLHNLGCRVCSNYACSVKYDSSEIGNLKVTDSLNVKDKIFHLRLELVPHSVREQRLLAAMIPAAHPVRFSLGANSDQEH